MLNVLITGARGELGRELLRIAALSPNRYTGLGRGELDIADRRAVTEALARGRYDAVVNCAAYTDVERAEAEEAEADRVNRLGAANLAAAAAATGTFLIHISTDYVFDGRTWRPYTEEDAPAPLGAYGRTKLAGEEAVRASGCRHMILRTAWLYSEFGHNFLKTMLRLTAEREEVKVVCDQVGTPTYAGDLALAIFSILESGHFAEHEGTYHFTDEGVASWYDFAVEIARAAGRDACRIVPCRTGEYPTRARRPACSLLDKTRFKSTFGIEIPHWRESLLYCLQRMSRASGAPDSDKPL